MKNASARFLLSPFLEPKWLEPKNKKIVVFLEKLQKTQNQKFWRSYFYTKVTPLPIGAPQAQQSGT